MVHSKTLNPQDYEEFDEHLHVLNIIGLIGQQNVRYEHPHRKWEYGIMLNALRQENVINILDVGGGGSAFAPAASYLDMNVIQVDPGHSEKLVSEQSRLLGIPLTYIKEDFFTFETDQLFDAVIALSVIEHVPDHFSFFDKMKRFVKPGGILAITTDFHPDGTPKVDGHLRTYNEECLMHLKDIIANDFEFLDGYDYSFFEPNVNNYTFASMILKEG